MASEKQIHPKKDVSSTEEQKRRMREFRNELEKGTEAQDHSARPDLSRGSD
ncbi:hypothetical protein [Actomonas aquatica]|uniref:Uncharacterized protein n=1 Tax=Actomonas aquatica TaxID=2866162 RepID=A0ABZ1CCR4_9BACT|nr:hypothetical protein [Opitutus sp. WL0086]WRQ88404.1 hypothetical protein K1X11_003245 [Opitutus sp. WL0086]